ncbi:single-stranded DNA binding protein [Halocatena pleomorpha]|uniref:Single-stranded DNA binding protein n=1 Tax=Halocatena pleomorpha TaxID=1785090 RepID=A0A3P3RBB9_9EURY|nr:single-stranded DNA binding protein [Halocatena pleomorpha]RRJ30746.1 single-stranded DNA binding protein [Halocatena pleomorpha]
MSQIEDLYEELDPSVDRETFQEAVEEKTEEMAGLVDTETAAQIVTHEVSDGQPNSIAAIDPGPTEVTFVGKVTSVGELRTFERDSDGSDGSADSGGSADGDDSDDGGDTGEDGHVLNVEVADETGRIRVSLWDERAIAAVEELDCGQVLRVKGRPTDGYSGIEVSANRVEPAPDTEIDVTVDSETTIEGLSMDQYDVTLSARVLATEPMRTFTRDDGSDGRVSNLLIGDETGHVRVALWDEQADSVDDLSAGESIEIIDGSVSERDGQLELHVGNGGTIELIDAAVQYALDATSIGSLAVGQTVDIAGVIRSTDSKRTFERDDGSEGQVRNVRVQDQTDDIRVALWGEKADIDIAPGDEALFAGVEIEDGWKDSIEASAGWRSTVTVLDDDTSAVDDANTTVAADSASSGADDRTESGSGSLVAFTDETADSSTDSQTSAERREFTGTVVQTGDPVILDDGQTTLSVATDADVHLGEEITVHGRVSNGTLDAENVL